MQKINILGVDLCNADMQTCLNLIQELLEDEKQHYFVTPNPEIILEAYNNEEYKKILNQASLQSIDGTGLIWAAKRLGHKFAQRVSGVDLMLAICEAAPNLRKRIFLLGAADGVANRTKEKLEEEIEGIEITGTFAGSPDEAYEEEIIQRIIDSEAHILFVAYGAPKQEKWIAKNLHKMPNIKLAGAVGGSFDFIAGNIKRAPKWMRNLGIEWAYRLAKEPKKRWKRIYNATIKFPITFLKNKN